MLHNRSEKICVKQGGTTSPMLFAASLQESFRALDQEEPMDGTSATFDLLMTLPALLSNSSCNA